MNNENRSEVDKFLENLPSEDKSEQDIFGDKSSQEVVDKEKDDKDEENEPRENRRQRRLREKLQQERESNIILAERLRQATEEKTMKEENPNIDPRLIRIFGTSEEGKELSKHFTDILSELKTSAREEAINQLQEQNQREELMAQEQEQEYENEIDENLEWIEEEYGVDLTSNSKEANKRRSELLELVEELSPKDKEGNLTGYADFGKTYELYQNLSREKIDNSRNKEIASRSMERSGSQGKQERPITGGFHGWKRDFGLE